MIKRLIKWVPIGIYYVVKYMVIIIGVLIFWPFVLLYIVLKKSRQ